MKIHEQSENHQTSFDWSFATTNLGVLFFFSSRRSRKGPSYISVPSIFDGRFCASLSQQRFSRDAAGPVARRQANTRLLFAVETPGSLSVCRLRLTAIQRDPGALSFHINRAIFAAGSSLSCPKRSISYHLWLLASL